MYEITVQADFAAAHAISIGGAREPVHGHNWHVEVTLSGSTLDADGLLCDFHTAEETLGQIVKRFHNRNLNEVPPFDTVNPSAEHVAVHIAEAMGERLGAGLAAMAWVSRVSVGEAPGCVATYYPQRR